jgi:short-subunit dehydrogenase
MRILITGASSGIGEAAALRFAREGARVGLLARRRERLDQVADRVRELGGEPLVLVADVASRGAVLEAAAETEALWGGVDVLVANAAIGLYAPLELVREEDLKRLFEVNVFGALYSIQAVLPEMKRQGRGVIINVSSIVGKRSLPLTGVYCATKFALQALSESLRVELRGTGVEVAVVCPGFTETEFGEATINYGFPRRRPRGMAMSAGAVAEVVYRCARKPRREVVLTATGRALVAVNRFFPGLTDRILTRYMRFTTTTAS